MTDATAAIADAPQIAVPTPTRCSKTVSTFSMRPAIGAKTSATAMVPIVTGNVSQPVCATAASERPNPETTIADCNTYLAENAKPACTACGNGRSERNPIPSTMASTGAPASGTTRASTVATSAIAAAANKPGRIFKTARRVR